jgi:hypothetical protein
MARTVSARIFDPLWLLSRQWQTAEFRGEDAGSPVVARVRATSASLTRCRLGTPGTDPAPQPIAYDPTTMPLETLVERQPVRPKGDDAAARLRLVVEAGLHFLRLLGQQPLSKNYRDAFIARYALHIEPVLLAGFDAASAAQLQLFVGRVPDARLLEAALRPGGRPDAALKIKAGDRAEVEEAARLWLAWYDALFSESADAGAGAWLPDRLEYAVSVAAGLAADGTADRTLTASEICEGELDWCDFDVDGQAPLAADGGRSMPVLQTVVPAPISFRGAPAARFWEFENAQIDFGLMSVGPGDLAHLLMIEYASSWGNDWFVVPLDLKVGTLTSIDSMVVSDTFGVRSLLRPIGDAALPAPNWSLFQMARLRPPGGAAQPGIQRNLFFLPPVLARSLQGPALEDVLFMRDEMANMAWAIEREVEGPLEAAVRRDAALAASTAAEVVAPAPTGPHYRLASEVPAHWIPLLPVQLAQPDGRVQSRLRRGAVLLADGSQQVRRAQGRVLNLDPTLLLHDEEVPREGVRVTRHYQLARWVDGSTHCWIGQRKSVGRGEGSSGLRFDRVESPDDPVP